MLEEIQKGMAEWRGQALAAAQAEAAARDALAAVEGQLASSQQAAAEERDRLGMEAAQCRLLCRARARQVIAFRVAFRNPACSPESLASLALMCDSHRGWSQIKIVSDLGISIWQDQPLSIFL